MISTRMGYSCIQARARETLTQFKDSGTIREQGVLDPICFYVRFIIDCLIAICDRERFEGIDVIQGWEIWLLFKPGSYIRICHG